MANARPFLDFLREHRNGQTHDELSDALQSLVASVVDEGKGGKLTLTISVKPAEKGDAALVVMDEIKLVPPKPTKGASIFYASPENNLVRQDPRQSVMELREIGGAVREPASIPASAAKALA